MLWGHAISKDLVHWQHLPIALNADQTYDRGGVWSGSATLVNGSPVLIYTGIGPGSVEAQCIAFPADLSDPFLTNWTKYPGNPIIPGPPDGIPTVGFRDPTTAWRSVDSAGQEMWYLVVGSGIPNDAAMVFLYQTADFRNFTFVHPFYASTDLNDTGNMWECPDFYALDGTHVLKFSIFTHHDMWNTGYYDQVNQVFIPDKSGLYDYGDVFYASKSFNDTQNNRQVLFGWVDESDSQNSINARGWAGVMSLPRQLTINSMNELQAFPIQELQSLRNAVHNFSLSTSQEEPLQGINSTQLEIQVSFSNLAPTVDTFGLKVLQGDQEETGIYFQMATGILNNTDFPGNDYRSVTLQALIPEQCQIFCNAETQCAAWAYSPPGMEGPSAMCWLKTFADQPSSKSGAYAGRKAVFNIDRSKSTLATDANLGPAQVVLEFVPEEVRVFVDHSIIEVYVDQGQKVLTSRVYPTLSASSGVSVFAVSGSVDFDVTVWELGSAW